MAVSDSSMRRPRCAAPWLVAALVVVLPTRAAAVSPTWLRLLGGLPAEDAADVDGTSDGGFVVVGSTDSGSAASGRDMLLCRLDTDGRIAWQAAADRTAHDWAHGVRVTPDGGAIVVGRTCPVTIDNAAWLMKLDAQGGIEWERYYEDAVAYAVRVRPDGKIVVAGNLVFELDSAGNHLRDWAPTEPGMPFLWNDLALTRDGGVILAGTRWSEADSRRQGRVAKLDPDWNVEWTRDYGEPLEADLQAVLELADGGFALAGSVREPMVYGREPLVIRVGDDGDILWDVVLAVGAEIVDLEAACDGGILAVAKAGRDAWILELDGDGRVVRQRAIDGPADQAPTASFLTPAEDLMIVGAAGAGALLLQVNRVARLDPACPYGHDTAHATIRGSVTTTPISLIPAPWTSPIDVPRTRLSDPAFTVATACEGPAELLPEDLPSEVTGLRVRRDAGDLTLTFAQGTQATACNVLEGTLGTWYAPMTASCFLRAGRELAVGADERLSYTLTPGAGDTWYLVSSSSCLGESTLGRSSFAERDAPASPWRCGALR